MNTKKSALGAAVVMGALVAFAGLPAGVARAGTGINVPCSGPGGGAAGLVAAINAANAAGGGTISLAPRCTYTLTAADNNSFGGNGLPVITTPITIAGAHATIARHSAQHFRIFEVDGPGGSLCQRADHHRRGRRRAGRRGVQQRRHAEAERQRRVRQRLRGRDDERRRRHRQRHDRHRPGRDPGAQRQPGDRQHDLGRRRRHLEPAGTAVLNASRVSATPPAAAAGSPAGRATRTRRSPPVA